MVYTQENRSIAIDTPLGPDVLLLTGFSGMEGISTPFSFALDLLSENNNITFEDIIGQNVTVSVVLADGDKRFFNGIISRFSQERGKGENDTGFHLAYYTATMVPWFWLLTRTSDSRIFQQVSVPDIVEQIFTEKGFADYRMNLHSSYDTKGYCVQYRETDFNFVSRLLEQEGIYYFFAHEDGKHTMILADAPEEHRPCPKQESVRYHHVSGGGTLEEDVITGLDKTQEIGIGKYTINDFNFEMPNTNLKVEVTSQNLLGPGEREVYDYPAEYSTRTEGDRLANIRIQEEEAKITTITGTSTCRAFTSGYRFDLLECFREDMNNNSYVLVTVNHGATEAVGTSGEGAVASYSNSFTCIPFDVPYRPPLATPKPMIGGVQTAIVVGPAGEEIYTDEHGRVKVQFHWDREGEKDENSSCWIRVSQVSAGAGWGSVSIPRIGHEVIVEFLEGDPDRPIITGSVYNGANTPPFGLPGGGMVSGSKSNSTPGGGGYNEMSMNDTKGEEKMTIHAQYDMDTTVEHDQTLTVHNNRTSTIDVDDSETVTGNQTLKVKGNRDETVDGTETITINSSRTEHVTGTEDVTIDAATTHTINADFTRSATGNYTLTADGNIKTDAGSNWEGLGGSKALLKAPEIKIEGESKIEIVCGGSSIKLEPAKITISSGSGNIEVHAPGVDIKGGKIQLN
jgi:type VI secretion system secreted protein VgrG